MLKLLWKALKILILVLLLGAVVFGIYYLVTWKQWPWWVGVAIGLGALGLVFGILFLRKWLFRRREKKFVERIVEQDESLMGRVPEGEPRELLDLEARWKEAVTILRRSHLKKHGNPIYVLPWYLFMGERGSGKTTSIWSSRLHSPVTEVSPGKADRPTRNVDWWFFETSVILDPAGRYTVFEDEELDKAEWKKFLSLMAKYRRKEPINGVIVTLPADRLVSAPEDELADYARTLRRRIDEIMRVGGARFPVWVMVTKADQISGFSDFGEALSEAALEQALGVANDPADKRPAVFIQEAVSLMAERIKDLRLLLLQQRPNQPGLLLFPEELTALGPRLVKFVNTAFEVNPYQETPLLRGLYFTSGQQKGKVGSKALTGAAGAWQRQLPDTAQGLFLRDFISRILPADSTMMTPLREFLSWKRLTKSLGLAAWVAFILCILGMVTLSFVKNTKTLTAMVEDFINPPTLTNDIWKNLPLLDKYRNELIEMHQLNQNWWVPRMGYDESLHVEKVLKQHYCLLFRQDVLHRWDQVLETRINGFSEQTPGKNIGSMVEHLESRVHLINAGLKGASASDLQKMPQIAYKAVVSPEHQVLSIVATEFSTLYPSYLEWTQNLNSTPLLDERDRLQKMIVQVTEAQGTTLRWLVDWANFQPDLKPVTLAEFWGSGPISGDQGVTVPAAYTRTGRDKIDQFLKRYEASLQNPGIVKKRLGDFNQWYWQQYVKVWSDFGIGFDQRYLVLSDEDEYRQLAATMANTNNPYFKLLGRMADELKPVEGKSDQTPAWVKEVIQLKDVQQQAGLDDSKKPGSTLTGRLKREAQKGEMAVKGALGPTAAAALPLDQLQNTITAAGYYNDYMKALGSAVAATGSQDDAFKMASAAFSGGSGDKDQSSFREANTALNSIKTTIAPQGSDRNNLFWRLLSGPYTYLLAYTIHEASCYLQLEWEGEVLAASADLPEAKLRTTLFDDQKGLIWKFTKGPAKPFLERNTQGYQAKAYLNNKFPFNPKFLGFLDKGASQTQLILPQYEVTIESLPTDVNNDADLEPFATQLVLDCDKGPQQLDNYNYPTKNTFKWIPSSCGDVTLRIKFDDFTLSKIYPGADGFQTFLDDFQGGSKTFTPADFPEQKDELSGIDVKTIRVIYKITGGAPVRKLLDKQTFQLPQTITNCMGL